MKKTKLCKLCKLCGTDDKSIYRGYYCYECYLLKQKQYYQDHKKERLIYAQQYRIDNAEPIKENKKKVYSKNIEIKKIQDALYYQNNKEKIKNKASKYYLENKNDPSFKEKKKIRKREYERHNSKLPNVKLHRQISKQIYYTLIKNDGVKNNQSCLKYLSYTINELQIHIESLFEPWMIWNNWGKYNAKMWNDNDPITWKWNLDHIIPQSDLPYDDMKHSNFKKCWALDNLRPLSAKQNILDGARKIRHRL